MSPNVNIFIYVLTFGRTSINMKLGNKNNTIKKLNIESRGYGITRLKLKKRLVAFQGQE